MFKPKGKKKEEKSEMEKLEELEQEVQKKKEALVEKHGDNVEADVEVMEVGESESQKELVEIPHDLKETIDVLQKTVAPVYNTQPLDQSIIQRDEMNALLLAIYHEIRQLRKEANKR